MILNNGDLKFHNMDIFYNLYDGEHFYLFLIMELNVV